MIARSNPQIGASVVIDVPVPGAAAVTQVIRAIVTVRDLGDGRFTCILKDEGSGAAEAVTIAPAPGGHWVCVAPPVDILGAMHTARRVLAGETLHGPALAPLLTLARAVEHLTGCVRSAGPCLPARIDGGRA
ncbi:hypothetical protein [Roseomonas genomospecies 6]|uniref:Uncharacterized protein n=1 Tax=Roseomonas genomospecies 6 TaxID=214106 RepID=A0A9W7KRK2_9PROT|nr:hypothetical protein [Roseomonas genomospecies 6]KAA0678106.1 hypothetical protein DS843_21220 [Roseomonas genomospecies 6]